MISIDKKKSGASLAAGFTSTFKAFPFIVRNRMLHLLILPLLVNIMLLCGIAWFAFIKTYPLLKSFLVFDKWYLQWLQYAAAPAIILLLLIASFFVYSITGTLITSPFLDIISIKTEKAIGGNVPDPGFSIKALLRLVTGMIRLLLLTILVFLIILPLNIIPGGPLIYAAAGFLITSFFCGVQFYDMPLERRGYTFSEKMQVCSAFAPAVAGTGMAFILMSAVPVVGFLAIVVSTCGATIAFREKMEQAIVKG